VSESGRSVSALQSRHELGDDEIVEGWSETPGLVTSETVRVDVGDDTNGPLESPAPTADAPFMAQSDGDHRLAWHRWFRPAHDGIDVGLDLFPFEADPGPDLAADSGVFAMAENEDPEPSQPSVPHSEADRTGNPRSQRMRIALIGLVSLAVLNVGALLSDPVEAPRSSPATDRGAPPRHPGPSGNLPESGAHRWPSHYWSPLLADAQTEFRSVRTDRFTAHPLAARL
jgi:hypothetical protein